MAKRAWSDPQVFESREEAENVIFSHSVCKYRTDARQDFTKFTFICRNKKLHKCDFQAQLIVADNSFSVRTSGVHDHAVRTQGLSSPVKAKVIDGIQLSLTLFQIKKSLTLANLEVPSDRMLNNFISYHKRTKFGTAALTTTEFQGWCQAQAYRENIPDHEPYGPPPNR